MTPERKKAFDGYVEVLRMAFESDDDRFPIRVAMKRPGEEKACAFAIVVVGDEIGEVGRMQMLAEIAREILPDNMLLGRPMPIRFDDEVYGVRK